MGSLPDAPFKCKQHHDGKPDEIQCNIKKVIWKNNHTGTCSAGKVDNDIPDPPKLFICEEGEDPEDEKALYKGQCIVKTI